MCKCRKVIEYSFKRCLLNMQNLRGRYCDDEISIDVENWYAVMKLIHEYEHEGKVNLIHPHKTLREELIAYFGDVERSELVLSYFTIAKDLIDNGVSLKV